MPDSPRSPAISGVVAGLRARLEAAEHAWWGQDLPGDPTQPRVRLARARNCENASCAEVVSYARNARRAEFDGQEWSHDRYSRLRAVILANLADLRLPRLSILRAGVLNKAASSSTWQMNGFVFLKVTGKWGFDGLV